MLQRLCLTLLLLIFAEYGKAAVSLEAHGHYLIDPHDQLALADVLNLEESRWHAIEQEFSLGLINDTAWVRLPLSDDLKSRVHGEAVLYLSNPLLNRINAYLVNHHNLMGEAQLGDHIPLQKKTIPLSDHYWELPSQWREATHLYLRIRTDSFFQSHFLIKSTAEALVDHGEHYWMLGVFYGALGIMLFYNLFLFFQVRDIRYLYYTGYVLMAGIFQSVMDGLVHYVLPRTPLNLGDRLSVYALDLANIFALLFIIKFLDLRDKKLLNATRTLILMFCAAIVIELVESGHISSLFSMFMTIVSALSITHLTVKSWLGGNEQARYLAMAWIVLLLSIPVYAMALYGVIPHNTYTLNSVRIGVLLELALISFSLAHRINLLRQERIMLQSRLNKELGALVRERTEELEKANAKLQAISETDSLTQLKNRAFLNKAIDDEAARAKRQHNSLTLLLADLDHFKRINDTIGHNAGDYCLKQFARIFAEQLARTTDIACRYGGEEFIAILPETDIEGAITVAEKIRSKVEETLLIFEGTPIDLTVSVGLFNVTPHADWNSQDWVGKADKALYFAKSRRNCVAFINSSGDPQMA